MGLHLREKAGWVGGEKKHTFVCPACLRVWRNVQVNGLRCSCGTDRPPDRYSQKCSVRWRQKGRFLDVIYAAKSGGKTLKTYERR